MTLSPLKSLAVACFALVCAGCSLDEDAISDGYDARANDQFGRPTRDLSGDGGRDLLGGGDIFSLGGGSEEAPGAQLPVNRYIWRSAVETLSFLPLASTDPYGGVIITDWSPVDAETGERLKVTALITSAEFKPQSLRVVVNKQRRADGGDWAAAEVSGDTVRQLEDSILTRARQLRQQDREDS